MRGAPSHLPGRRALCSAHGNVRLKHVRRRAMKEGSAWTSGHPPATEEELVHAYADLFNEVEPETPEEIDAVLREGGHDPDSIAARMKSFAERALARSPLNWRNRAQLKLDAEERKLDSVTPIVRRGRGEMITAIQQLLSRLQARQLAPAHAYRNFDQATDEDLASLLARLEYLIAGKPAYEDEK